MPLPATTQDVWTPATDGDKLTALASLGGLPSRQSSSAEFDQATFYVALEGATRHGLAEAVKAILQGGLGHGFFPSPPELRIQCDDAMKHHEKMRTDVHRREQIHRERPPEISPLTDDAKERQRKRMAAFHARMDDGSAAESAAAAEAERADIRARYGMTDEAIAGVKDNPKARERMGAGS